MSTASLEDRVRVTGDLPAGVPVVVGLSGGRDSLCLLDVAVRLVGRDAVLAVHVHHGLRGRSADADAIAATEVAGVLGVAVRVVRLRVPDAVRVATGSPVPWARDARRDVLRASADAWAGRGCPVAVAHTATDQAETVLLRAISSPGARSLAGIAVRDDERHVVRPLLAAGVTRLEAGERCLERGLTWRDDPTNAGSPRGRVRALLPALEAIDGRAVRALGRTAALAREDEVALTAAADAVVAAARVDGPEGAGVSRASLAALPLAVGRRVLRRLAEDATGGSCPRAGSRLEEVLSLGPHGEATLDLGDGARAVLRAGVVRCVASPARR